MLDAVGIPLISIIDETIRAIGELSPGVGKVGVLATDGCLKADVYQKALRRNELSPVLPNEDEMARLMELIGRIKAGDKSEAVSAAMQQLANTLVSRGAQVVIAACTEIPLVLDETMMSVPLVSSTDVLAQRTVQLARGDLPLTDRE